jgi:hypothetical protein
VEQFNMKITQIFRSSRGQRLISQIELIGPGAAIVIPCVGDNLSWVVEGKTYEGTVKSRLVSYSAPDKIGLERSDETDITVALSVEMATN